MECILAREALSARIDGEREPVPPARVDEHLADCASCRDWQVAAIEQTRQLRRLAGRSQVTAVPAWRSADDRRRLPRVSLRRWALAAVGLVQLALAMAQVSGAHLGMPPAAMGGHLLNESTAWSAALGVVMVAAALRPSAAAGLAWVLWAFVVVLTGYVIHDAAMGAVTLDRVLSHLPLVIAAALALLVSRTDRPDDSQPDFARLVEPRDEVDLTVRRRRLDTTDGSAA